MPSDVARRPHRPLLLRDAVIAPGETWESIGAGVAALAIDHRLGLRWWLAFVGALGLVGLMAGVVTWLLIDGVGIWGNNIPVAWALDIVSYDWWIGIASGGLMVSAVLLLLDTEWRGGLNRITETMALVSAAAAGLYPIIHLGRPWFFYWNLPYPNTFLLWPQVRSPLFWDAIDILSYLGICLSFWYVGMLPDLASLRDRAVERWRAGGTRDGSWLRLLRAQLYGIAALGWRGSAVHWQRWTQAYRTIALFGLVLVVSLQTGAAVMFAGSVEPGWHDALLPMAFLAAALFAGVAMVAVMAVVLRAVFGLRHLVTERHLDLVALLLLALAWFNIYCYAAEFLTTLLTGSAFDKAVLGRRFSGEQGWSGWAIVVLALLPVQVLWLPGLRRSAPVLAIVGLLAAAGMYFDHYMVIVVTLQHDFLPSSVHPYGPDIWGIATFLGSIGLFLSLLLLFLRYLPAVSILEIRRLVAGGGLEPRGPARTRMVPRG